MKESVFCFYLFLCLSLPVSTIVFCTVSSYDAFHLINFMITILIIKSVSIWTSGTKVWLTWIKCFFYLIFFSGSERISNYLFDSSLNCVILGKLWFNLSFMMNLWVPVSIWTSPPSQFPFVCLVLSGLFYVYLNVTF